MNADPVPAETRACTCIVPHVEPSRAPAPCRACGGMVPGMGRSSAAPSLHASPSPASLPVSAESTPALRTRVERLRARHMADLDTLRSTRSTYTQPLATACDNSARDLVAAEADLLNRYRSSAASAIWSALLACEALRDAERATGNVERGDRAADDADELRSIHASMVKE